MAQLPVYSTTAALIGTSIFATLLIGIAIVVLLRRPPR